mgnify:CR=1 FL=1
MISFRACVYKVVERLAQSMVLADEGRVFRASDRRLPQDPLEQRIVELGDGRSTGEIVETLYVEEIRAGAWIVDIALWKYIFDRMVAVTIRRLADRGYLKLEPKS